MKKSVVKIISLVLLSAFMLAFASCGSIESAAKDAKKVLKENWNKYAGDAYSYFYYEEKMTTYEGQQYYLVDVYMSTKGKNTLNENYGKYAQMLSETLINDTFKDSTIYSDLAEEFEKYPEVDVMIIFFDINDEAAYYYSFGNFKYLEK